MELIVRFLFYLIRRMEYLSEELTSIFLKLASHRPDFVLKIAERLSETTTLTYFGLSITLAVIVITSFLFTQLAIKFLFAKNTKVFISFYNALEPIADDVVCAFSKANLHPIKLPFKQTVDHDTLLDDIDHAISHCNAVICIPGAQQSFVDHEVAMAFAKRKPLLIIASAPEYARLPNTAKKGYPVFSLHELQKEQFRSLAYFCSYLSADFRSTIRLYAAALKHVYACITLILSTYIVSGCILVVNNVPSDVAGGWLIIITLFFLLIPYAAFTTKRQWLRKKVHDAACAKRFQENDLPDELDYALSRRSLLSVLYRGEIRPEHELSTLSKNDKPRLGIENDWCTPEVSAPLRAKRGLDQPETSSLGERECDTQRLEEAVEAYRATLRERTPERVPLQWAMTQNNLGNALAMLGERESSTRRLREAVASFSNVLQVDPDDEGAYANAQFLYHEKLFAFAEAFHLNQAWLARHPNDIDAQINFAGAAFTLGRFAEAEQWLAVLVDHPELNPGTMVALRALEICNLVALGKSDTLRAKLAALSDVLKSGFDELAVDWSFAGSRHFIGGHPELRRHPWLIRLLAAVEERNAADARAAVGVGQPASAVAPQSDELEESAFFPSKRQQPAPPPAVQNVNQPKPTETAVPTIKPKPHIPERANAPSPERPNGKRIITRNSFEIYEDQMDSLRKLSFQEEMEGKLGSMSGMVREAIDNYLLKRTTEISHTRTPERPERPERTTERRIERDYTTPA